MLGFLFRSCTRGSVVFGLERAQKRLSLVVPIALAIIFGMLLWTFQDFRVALGVFAIVPFALTGGIVGLLARGLSFSIPAAVGLIALAGVAVLNGVVVANEVRAKVASGWPLEHAVGDGAVYACAQCLLRVRWPRWGSCRWHWRPALAPRCSALSQPWS